jgi:hypothetical protein
MSQESLKRELEMWKREADAWKREAHIVQTELDVANRMNAQLRREIAELNEKINYAIPATERR